MIALLAEICLASRLDADKRQALILEINEYAKSLLNLTSDYPATKDFLADAQRMGLTPNASDFAHISVGIDENEDCFVLRREKGAKNAIKQVGEIAKVIYAFYLHTYGNLQSPFNLAILPRSWSICRRYKVGYIRYDYSSQIFNVKDPIAAIFTSGKIWKTWVHREMFSLGARRRLSDIWDIIDPVGKVMTTVRNLAYVKFDNLGKTLNPPRRLPHSSKETILISLLSKMIFIGPNCESPLSYLSLRALFVATKMSNAKHVLCLDATGGHGPAKDISTRIRNGRNSASVLQTITQTIDQLTVEDVYKIKRRKMVPSLETRVGLIMIE